MKKLLYILLFLPLPCFGQMLINSFISFPPAGGGSYPTTNLLFGFIGTTNVTQSSNAISAWADINGSGRNITQATAGAKPTWNSSSIVQFDGSTDYMAGTYNPASSGFNFYCRFRSSDVNNASSGIILFEAGDLTGNAIEIYVFAGTVYLSTYSGGAGGGSVTTAPTLVNNTWYTLYATLDGAGNASIQIDANAAGTGSVTVPGSITAGIHAGALYAGGSPAAFGVAYETKAYMWYGSQSAGDVTSTKTYLGTL